MHVGLPGQPLLRMAVEEVLAVPDILDTRQSLPLEVIDDKAVLDL
jgi:hypothetical protein